MERVIMIDATGKTETCDSLQEMAEKVNSDITKLLYLIDTGEADSKGRTYDFAIA